MKLVTYTHGGSTQGGIVIDEQVYPLSGFGLPSSIVEFLALEDAGMTKLADASKSASDGTPIGDVELEAAIPNPTRTMRAFCAALTLRASATWMRRWAGYWRPFAKSVWRKTPSSSCGAIMVFCSVSTPSGANTRSTNTRCVRRC